MSLFKGDKHKASDDTSKLNAKMKKIKTEKQKANRRQGKVIDLKSEKKSNVKKKLW